MDEEKLDKLESKLNQLDEALASKDEALASKDEALASKSKVIGVLAEENKKLKAQLKDDETAYASENEHLIKQYLGKK